MDIFIYLATHYKIVFSFKTIYASPICFGASCAIIRRFVVENQVLICIGRFVFGLTVVVDSVLFPFLRSWLVYEDAFYVCSIVLLYEWFILCFIYMFTYFSVALVPFFAATLSLGGRCVSDLFLRLLLHSVMLVALLACLRFLVDPCLVQSS